MGQVLVFILFFCVPLMAWADVPIVYYDGRPLDIAVAEGKITEVIFPEKVAKIIKGGGADSVLIEVLENSVFILSKNEKPADIFVTGIKGESYPLNLIVGKTYKAKLKVEYAFDPNRSVGDNRGDVMDLMKLLIQGRVPAGATVLQGDEKKLIAQGQIKLVLNSVFDLPKLNGLVLTVSNLSKNMAIIPIQSIAYPRLLAISAEVDGLSAKGEAGDSARIFMVVGK